MALAINYLIFTFGIIICNAFADNKAELAWKTYISVDDPLTTPSQLSWMQGAWKLAAITQGNANSDVEYRLVERLEIYRIDYGFNINPATKVTAMEFSAIAYGAKQLPENQRVIFYTLGFSSGIFYLGPAAQSDTFDLRKSAGKKPSAFVIKHRITGDILMFERTPENLKTKR
jgi:hypothetical protein